MRQFLLTQLIALGALIGCASVVACFAVIDALTNRGSLITPIDAAIISFGYTVVIGFLPVVLVGAPLFYILHHFDRATWGAAIVLGAAPGLIMALLTQDIELSFWATGCGMAVAVITRALGGQGRMN